MTTRQKHNPRPPSQPGSLTMAFASESEVDLVLKDTYSLWGLELGRQGYADFIWAQLRHPWGRRHFKYIVGKAGAQIVTSLKLYDLPWQCRGCTYKLAGVGAVFTPQRFRGRGYGAGLLDQLSGYCQGAGYDGLLLHSDIDVSFYEELGYSQLGSTDFHLLVADLPAQDKEAQTLAASVRAVTLADVPDMVRHYQWWLPERPYGAQRSQKYWHYKLGKELTMQSNSRRNRPQIEIIGHNLGASGGGYALVEFVHPVMRVLEVSGAPAAVERLWAGVFALAQSRRAVLIRGWIAVCPFDYVSIRLLKYVERPWSRPMLKPLAARLESWLAEPICPVLELGHF